MNSRIEPKRRAEINYKKKQFSEPKFAATGYKHRLNFYSLPPSAEITLEEFEEWAIHRLKGAYTLVAMPGLSFINRMLSKFSPNSKPARSAIEAGTRQSNT